MALVHGITAGGVSNVELGAGMGEFINRYIFPGGELMHVSRVLHDMAGSGLEMVDTENLRPHYARTLWAWSDALEAQLGRRPRSCSSSAERAAKALRAYRLYLAGSPWASSMAGLRCIRCCAANPMAICVSGAMRVRRAAILSTANTSTVEGTSSMPYKFKSRATADLIMLDANGRKLLVIGKSGRAGIITVEQIPAPLPRWRRRWWKTKSAASPEEEARRNEAGEALPARTSVGLGQRIVPFVDMLSAVRRGKEVTW
jgi:cyclopropane-fatty-acyl-phospholipid synthase